MTKAKTETASDPADWLVVRSTVNLPRLPRDHVALVNINDPEVQKKLRATYLVPLPLNEQPKLRIDPETLLPILEVNLA